MGLTMSPEHSASPGPGAPYRQVSCEACGEASAAEICPLCKRPICAGCHHIRAELGRKTLEGILGAVTRQDSRSEKKLAAREMLKSVATGVGAGLGLPLILMPFKGLQVLMASLALVPIFTFKELVGWYRSRSQEREARFMEPRDLEPEVAALAPARRAVGAPPAWART